MKHLAIIKTVDAYPKLTPSQRMELFQKELLIYKTKQNGK